VPEWRVRLFDHQLARLLNSSVPPLAQRRAAVTRTGHCGPACRIMPFNTVPKVHTKTIDAIAGEFTALPQVVHIPISWRRQLPVRYPI
jgi:hypothetical protein